MNQSVSTLTIIGNRNLLETFMLNAESEDTVFSLIQLCPIPDEEPSENWLDWRLANWGTKWDSSNASITVTDTAITYQFTNPILPPLLALDSISRNYPSLTFKLFYVNEFSDICGESFFQDGLINDRTVSYADNFIPKIEIDYNSIIEKDGVVSLSILFSHNLEPLNLQSEPFKSTINASFPSILSDLNLEIDPIDYIKLDNDFLDTHIDKNQIISLVIQEVLPNLESILSNSTTLKPKF